MGRLFTCEAIFNYRRNMRARE